jgi:hypothetical protein
MNRMRRGEHVIAGISRPMVFILSILFILSKTST